MEEVKAQMKEFLGKPRRKVIPGENIPKDQVTMSDIQLKFGIVESELGKEAVHKILVRIPAAGIASIKESEYSRALRLCDYFLDLDKKLQGPTR